MNDKIESLLGEIESSLKIIIFTLLFFALGSCYYIGEICDEVKEQNDAKKIETPVEAVQTQTKNEVQP